jgi:hypothetical protein
LNYIGYIHILYTNPQEFKWRRKERAGRWEAERSEREWLR